METALPLPVELLHIIGEALPRLSKSARTRLAVDLSGCFWGLRTGVLVDSIMLSKTEVDALNRSLKSNRLPLAFAYEAVTEQTLLVNLDFASRLNDGNERNCIEVGGEKPVLSLHPSPHELAVLSSIASFDRTSNLTLVLPTPENPYDLVAVVGRLLDYPLPYSLSGSADGRNCLGGVELVVVEAFLVGLSGRQRLLSFSYPSSFADDAATPALSAANVSTSIRALLQQRLEKSAREHYGELGECSIEVQSHLATLDRVAL